MDKWIKRRLFIFSDFYISKDNLLDANFGGSRTDFGISENLFCMYIENRLLKCKWMIKNKRF